MTTTYSSQHNDSNPWKGLNFYLEGETIYGRDNEIQSLAQYIINNTQTVLYGKSGIGKSSILNAGVFPKARREGLFPIPIRLKHDRGASYLAQIRVAFESSGIGIREVVPVIDANRETLWEYLHRHTFYDARTQTDVRPLVVFDQFEEIFTLQHDENKKRAFFSELADLLNDVTPQYVIDAANNRASNAKSKKGPAASSGFVLDFGATADEQADDYVASSQFNLVFSIREDFLSYLERYTTYIPVMKSNRFALLPINEEQAADIIMKPREGLVSKEVAELIIQKVTGRTDFTLDGVPEIEVDAAVLSLYLSRLYIKKGEGTTAITAELVNQFSDDIIKDFYEESVADLPAEYVEEIEDQLLTYDGRRNNVSRNDLLREGIPEDVIRILADDRKLLRQFSYQDDIRVEFMHDILCPIVDARIDQRELARQQEEERRRQEEEKAKMEAERQEMFRKQQRDRRRFRRTLLWSVLTVLLLIGAYFANAWWTVWEYSEYYRSFVRQNGWPVGVGEPLSEQEAKTLTVSYRLSRQGRNPSKPFSQVDVCSSTDIVQPNFRSPLVGVNESNDVRANEFSNLNMKVRTIRFAAENDAADAGVSRELYYDADEQLLYAVNYYRSFDQNMLEGSQALSMWAVYVDQNGLPLKVRDNGADRMKVFLSSSDQEELDKLEVKYMFYDEHGSPQRNDIGCYGFRMVYNKDRTTDSLMHLNPFSMESMVEVRTYSGNETTMTYYAMGEENKQTAHRQLGYAKRVEVQDDKGNVVERRFYAENGKLVVGTRHCAIEKRHYDQYNRLDSVSFLNHQEQQTGYGLYRYAEQSNFCSEYYLYAIKENGTSQLNFMKIRRTVGEVTDNIDDDRLRDTYRHEHIVKKEDVDEVEYSYLDRDGQLKLDSVKRCARYVERNQQHGEGTIRVSRYYDVKNQLCRASEELRVVAVDSAYYDKDGLRRSQVSFDADGKVLVSMGYDYKDGVEISRYALSLDGHTPIRCPNWEIDGLCYHRLNNVKNAQTGFNLAYIQAVSEYGSCPSYVYWPMKKDTTYYAFDPVVTAMGEGWLQQERFSVSIPPVPAKAHTVQYVHITDLKGAAYKAGLRDGDLLQEQQSAGSAEWLITVVRYENGKWKKPQPFRISKTDAGMEVYPVAYTEEEYAFYNKGRAGL